MNFLKVFLFLQTESPKVIKAEETVVANSILEMKLITFFFYTSIEIRELEAKLRAGYMNKERAVQLAEKVAREVTIKVRDWNYALFEQSWNKLVVCRMKCFFIKFKNN